MVMSTDTASVIEVVWSCYNEMTAIRIGTAHLQPVCGDRNMAITSHHRHNVLIYCDQYPKNGYRGIITDKFKAMGVSHCNRGTVFYFVPP